MERTQGHTPGPWTAHDRMESRGDFLITGKLGEVGVARTLKAKGDQQSANAAFIVRAVNAHDKLVQALKDALQVLKNPEEDGYPNKLAVEAATLALNEVGGA